MRITDIEAIHLQLTEVAEIADGTQDILVSRIVGLVGIGEVSIQSYVCKAIVNAPRSAERRHGLRAIVIGQEIDDVETLWDRMYYHTNRYGRRALLRRACRAQTKG